MTLISPSSPQTPGVPTTPAAPPTTDAGRPDPRNPPALTHPSPVGAAPPTVLSQWLPPGWSATPLTGTFGIELTGGSITDVDPAGLVALLHQHLVVVIRNQELSPTQQVGLAGAMGTPTPAHPVVPGRHDHPEILELDASEGGRNARWHTDVTFVVEPPAASILTTSETPVAGGDTLWADLRGAYESLSAPIRDMVDNLWAVHKVSPLAYWGEPFDTALSRDDAWQLHEQALTVPPVVHPVVRVHPATSMRSLFVNPGFTSHLVGMSRHESDQLLALLYGHATQPEHVVRHRWQAGDVVMWDNRSTMHYATNDFGEGRRLMRRVTLAGERPHNPSGTPSSLADDPLVAIR